MFTAGWLGVARGVGRSGVACGGGGGRTPGGGPGCASDVRLTLSRESNSTLNGNLNDIFYSLILDLG